MSTYRSTKLIIQENCNSFRWMTKHSPSPNDWDQVLVGRRFKAAHLAKGWDSATFAGMLKGDVTPQKLSNWENGRHMLPIDVAIRAGTLTGLEITFFYQGRMDRIDPEYAVKISAELDKIEDKPPRKVARRA
jgi:transcriptional regulator with XRE-family HTH domain